MEYIKLIGATLIIFAGAGFGSCPVHRMKERTREMEELYFCLLRLKSEIRHEVKPLPEALLGATESKKGKSGGAYRTVMRQMGKRMQTGQEAYGVLVQDCAKEGFLDSVITKEEQEAFVETFLLLGGADREKQSQILEYYADSVRRMGAQEAQKKKEKANLYRSLGVLGGIFLSVILY